MWIITKDRLDKKKVNVQSADYDENKANTLIHPFRLLDDDGVVCLEGRSTDSSSEDAFRPLDEYGMGGFGCTMIQYKDESGKWCQL